MSNDNRFNNLGEEPFANKVTAIVERIYRAYLPPYLEESWQGGRGGCYEDWIREQLDTLVISELYEDAERLAELERLQDRVGLVLGILGAAFRILDHIGMHLRGQTLGQYELLPEDETLLRQLCQRFLKARPIEFNPIYGLS